MTATEAPPAPIRRDYIVHGHRNGRPVVVLVEDTTIGQAPVEAKVERPFVVHRAAGSPCYEHAEAVPGA